MFEFQHKSNQRNIFIFMLYHQQEALFLAPDIIIIITITFVVGDILKLEGKARKGLLCCSNGL